MGLQISRRQTGQAESSEEAIREVTLSSFPILSSQPQVPSIENMSWYGSVDVSIILCIKRSLSLPFQLPLPPTPCLPVSRKPRSPGDFPFVAAVLATPFF